MKRSTPTLRQPIERKSDTQGQYGEYIKHQNNINPIFTNKPWLGGKEEKNGNTDR